MLQEEHAPGRFARSTDRLFGADTPGFTGLDHAVSLLTRKPQKKLRFQRGQERAIGALPGWFAHRLDPFQLLCKGTSAAA
jgi:hypothetical protein